MLINRARLGVNGGVFARDDFPAKLREAKKTEITMVLTIKLNIFSLHDHGIKISASDSCNLSNFCALTNHCDQDSHLPVFRGG